MKPTNNTSCSFRGAGGLEAHIAKKFANSGEIGEGVSIACDFLGKAILVPAVLMAASDEPKEKKEYSALKNPVAAVIQLLMEVPILHIGGKLVEKAADNGFFDRANSDFTYNQKACRENFIDVFEKSNLKKDCEGFLDEIKKQGYSKKLAEKFNDTVQNLDEITKNRLVSSFKKLENAYKNQFHLKNRICFIAALALTPAMCALENKLHPKIMKIVYKHENKNKENTLKFNVNIGQFVSDTKGGAK